MGELQEFAEALFDQIAVELGEEKHIAELSSQISEDPEFKAEFEAPEAVTEKILPELKRKVAEFTGMAVDDQVAVEFPELAELKMLKGKKVFPTESARPFVDGLFEAISREDKPKLVELIERDAAKFITYSTYAKSYISKISTTYGDYLDSKIYLNRFILARYPRIILYRQGAPYEARFGTVDAGYRGALKMAVLEELVHSVQGNLHKINREAVTRVNGLNEDLAKAILSLDDGAARGLTDYLQLQAVPDDFPIARRANLFFMLNPDNFVMNALGPDVLTFTRVDVDPKIAEYVPQLLGIYQQWLKPIQDHEAAFSVMEGMAEFCVQGILSGDGDFQEYLKGFGGADTSAYRVRKSMGRDFVKATFERHGKGAFEKIIGNPPTTQELKDPQSYLKNR